MSEGPGRGVVVALLLAVLTGCVGGVTREPTMTTVGRASSETATPGAVANQPPQPVILWSTDSDVQDWPGPLRPEPAGDETDVDLFGAYQDPEGDAGLDVVDINEVLSRLGCWMTLTTERCVIFDTVVPPEPFLDPADTWIAHGIVVDYTGDSRPDVRFGIDNAADSGALRMWRTDMNTGETITPGVTSLEDPRPPPGGAGMDAEVPDSESGELGNGHIFVVETQSERTFRFYVWASAIRHGEIVATDYAPDAGWLAIETRHYGSD